jgi:hypothetical protein
MFLNAWIQRERPEGLLHRRRVLHLKMYIKKAQQICAEMLLVSRRRNHHLFVLGFVFLLLPVVSEVCLLSFSMLNTPSPIFFIFYPICVPFLILLIRPHFSNDQFKCASPFVT